MKIVSNIFIIFFILLGFSDVSLAQTTAPIKILLVPGHDNEVWGAQYKNLKEADMTLAVASRIYDILSKDKRFEVHITRDKDGYTKEFADYFAKNQAPILSFKENAKKVTQSDIVDGTFIPKKGVIPHNSVTENVAIHLYGFNKWANENNIDAMIHIHFNDDGRKNKSKPGPWKGFSVYMPDPQLVNSTKSAPLALGIFNALKKKYFDAVGIKKNGGVIVDQGLIALGANGTLLPSVRSTLIEYAYIYEKMFNTYAKRQVAYQNMADITANAIINYFFPN